MTQNTALRIGLVFDQRPRLGRRLPGRRHSRAQGMAHAAIAAPALAGRDPADPGRAPVIEATLRELVDRKAASWC
jgi:hypothetical protein